MYCLDSWGHQAVRVEICNMRVSEQQWRIRKTWFLPRLAKCYFHVEAGRSKRTPKVTDSLRTGYLPIAILHWQNINVLMMVKNRGNWWQTIYRKWSNCFSMPFENHRKGSRLGDRVRGNLSRLNLQQRCRTRKWKERQNHKTELFNQPCFKSCDELDQSVFDHLQWDLGLCSGNMTKSEKWQAIMKNMSSTNHNLPTRVDQSLEIETLRLLRYMNLRICWGERIVNLHKCRKFT